MRPSITEEGLVVTRIGVFALCDTTVEEGRSTAGKGQVGSGVLAEDLDTRIVGAMEDRRLTVGCRSSAAVVLM